MSPALATVLVFSAAWLVGCLLLHDLRKPRVEREAVSPTEGTRS